MAAGAEQCGSVRAARFFLALLLAACLPLAAGQSQFAGNTYVPNNPLKVCITSYPPFTMSALYLTGGEVDGVHIKGPVPYDVLQGLLPTGVPLSSAQLLGNPDAVLAGFDMEYAQLVFERMLGLNLSYMAYSSFPQMYLALRAGQCDVAISAAEMDPVRTVCTSMCPLDTSILNLSDYQNSVDYADGGFDDSVLAAQCCLEYGAPYLSSGFALISIVSSAPLDVQKALFNADVFNAFMVLIIIIVAIGWVTAVVEHSNPHLGSVSRSTLWGLAHFLLCAWHEPPRTRMGRALGLIMATSAFIGIDVITSIVSAKLSIAGLSTKTIRALSDVTGTLCIESAYPVVEQFVKRDPFAPTSQIFLSVNECIAMLLDGTAQAVLTDRPVLSWFATTYSLKSSVYVSPVLGPNPFSFVYASSANSTGPSLRQYVNPAVLATITDKDWVPLAQGLSTKYFVGTAATAGEARVTPYNLTTLIVASSLVIATVMVSLFNGECGTGLSFLPRVKSALAAPPFPEGVGAALDRDAAIQAVARQLEELKALLLGLSTSSSGLEQGDDDAEARRQLSSYSLK